ncbi:hypothetical protein [Nodularia spumigena]|jgi:hypothetical protein|uniref:hypothetical protein n=1 Tax=Nodularia spumigena TaxID=70799 RepID=UPI00232ECA3E|nr:hypothetical protein [Nodularia spumigena]MDB9500047.1 hypothetical protein [Nodularia spumigena CS-336/02]
MKRANYKCEFCFAPHRYLIVRKKRALPDEFRILATPEQKEFFNDIKNDEFVLTGLKPTVVVLTIAHLDHDKHNHQVTDDRLKALCQRCHLDYDRSRHINNRKYGRNWLTNQTSLDL